MKTNVFDDQYQALPSWLEKLASDEQSNLTQIDTDISLNEKEKKKYSGISTTWNNKKSVKAPLLDDSIREVNNKCSNELSKDQIEKQARYMLMTGNSPEKIVNTLKRKISKDAMNSFDIAKIESEFGKLGHIYLDASLVDDCSDLSIISKNASVSLKTMLTSIKKISKCEKCQCNKKGICTKTALNISDDVSIKTAAQAKNIINKFATMKYVNSYFVKSMDIDKFYTKLASENPNKVINEFLLEIRNRRTSNSKVNRVIAKNTDNNLKNNEKIVKLGKDDNEIEIAFKQSLLQNPSIRTAKSIVSKKYGTERVNRYFNEARDLISKYAKFIVKKSNNGINRENNIESTPLINVAEKVEDLTPAIKAAYYLQSIQTPIESIKKSLQNSFGQSIASKVIEKLNNDSEAKLLGLTYIDSNLYSSPEELQEAFSVASRRACNMIFQIKEGPLCKSASNKCAITGLSIVKNASVDSKQQAIKVINHARKIGFKVDDISSKLRDKNNTQVIKSFVAASIANKIGAKKTTKKISLEQVSKIVKVASKFSNDNFDKILSSNWSTHDSLINALQKNIKDKTSFVKIANLVVNKPTEGINDCLANTNLFNVELFSNETNSQEVAFGKTF